VTHLSKVFIEHILPNPQQPRQEFDADALQELADSIRINGLIQRPTVEEAADGYYIIHDGERRLRAAKLAGLTEIEVVVEPSRNGDGPKERLTRAMVANAHRADLNPMEKARAFRQMQNMDMTHRQIARVLRISENTVASHLKLLELDEDLQELVAMGQLPHDVRVVRALLSIPSADARMRLGQRLARPGITIKGIENACARLRERLLGERKTQVAQSPIMALAGEIPDAERKETWPRVRAAAQGMCDACDANPKLPDAPEPAWSLIVDAANQTCDACTLRAMANLSVCKQCPGVELLKRMAAA
jgi:ParB family chromosome partitioning protein